MDIKIYRNKMTNCLECLPYESISPELDFLGTADSKHIRFECYKEVDKQFHEDDIVSVAESTNMDPDFIEALKTDASIRDRALYLYEKFLSNEEGWNQDCEEALSVALNEFKLQQEKNK